jgi:hypothetical protein
MVKNISSLTSSSLKKLQSIETQAKSYFAAKLQRLKHMKQDTIRTLHQETAKLARAVPLVSETKSHITGKTLVKPTESF